MITKRKRVQVLGSRIFIGEKSLNSLLSFVLSLLTSLLHLRGFPADIFTAFFLLTLRIFTIEDFFNTPFLT